MWGSKRWRAVVSTCALALCLGASSLPAAVAADGGERHSDIWLKASLVTTYALNQHLSPFDIDVDVKDGIATLRGDVDTSVDKDLAGELAKGIDGIRRVDNQLQISGKSGDRSRHGFMEQVDDANITAKVKSQLLWNSNTQGMRIDVDTEGGVVSLRGEVASAAEADLAAQIARNTSGVRRVDNHLSVNPNQQHVEQLAKQAASDLKGDLSDAWITTKVKTSLLYNRGVDAASIDVRTKNHVVTLSGEVRGSYEVKRAEQIAGSVVGVRSVQNDLRVTGEQGN